MALSPYASMSKYPKIKLIATDLDGTLLRSDLTVSQRTIDVLRRCRASGIKIIFATGRGGSAELIVPPGIFDGRITNNGAVTVADGVTYKRLIPCMEARALLLACDKRGFMLTSQISDMHYTNFDVAPIWPQVKNYKIVDFNIHGLDAEKICMDVKTDDEEAFIRSRLTENMYLTIARDGLGMIMCRDATKSKALAGLAEVWCIDKNEIVAFGDDLNDVDMLSYAGVGVAMGNALEEARAAAGHICKTNDEDGVADWLEEHIVI